MRINILNVIALQLMAMMAVSCSEFLDEKPDQSMTLPTTLRDLQFLLDHTTNMNSNLPGLGEEYSDNTFLTDQAWAGLSQTDRENYCFDNRHTIGGRWSGAYRTLFYANLVIDELPNVEQSRRQQYNPRHIEGAALFYRAHTNYHLVQVYAKHYNSKTAERDLGVVLRRRSAIDEKLRRATVAETYSAILADLEKAARLLPSSASVITRPTLGAAYAMLARIYLTMADYQKAGQYADSTLAIQYHLIDYNTLDSSSNTPFSLFNSEVIYQNRMTATTLVPTRACIHPDLLGLYGKGDLRKPLFFRPNGDGTFRFKGFYDGLASSTMFNGISTAELLLTKAECLARTGQKAEALSVLNDLLVMRWESGLFTPRTLDNTPDILNTILTERRKELPYRGLRWVDLRRLAQEGLFMGTIERTVDGKTYTLHAADIPQVAFKLPDDPINIGGYIQN